MHLAIGTPMYSGQCYGEFASSVMELQDAIVGRGGRLSRIFIGNESLITRGRDTVAHIFHNHTDATHLLFADADLKFRAKDVLRMVQADKDVMCGPVAKKGLDWERAGAAAKRGASDIANFAAVWSVKSAAGNDVALTQGEMIEIEYAGGFILIGRRVFDAMREATPAYRGSPSVRREMVRHYFATEIRDGEFLSEDYAFCRRWRDLGGKVWLAPWCEIKHYGTYAFGGT